MTAAEIIELLSEEYGHLDLERRGDPISTLVGTILSQNTSDHNSSRAFSSLLATFGSWEAMAEADVDDIAQAIKSGGLARVKAPRIKLILNQIIAQRGSLDLSFLGELPMPEARTWLGALPGVGPKTAGCVLLFSLGRPALPVDTHVYRVARRLGLIDSKASVERAHQVLEGILRPDQVYQFHVLLIEHGRRVCKTRGPRCHQCVLREGCPWYLGGKN